MNSDGVDGESSTMATVNVASPPPRHLSNLERAAGLSSPALGVERVKSKGKGKGKGKLEPSEAVREQFDVGFRPLDGSMDPPPLAGCTGHADGGSALLGRSTWSIISSHHTSTGL